MTIFTEAQFGLIDAIARWNRKANEEIKKGKAYHNYKMEEVEIEG